MNRQFVRIATRPPTISWRPFARWQLPRRRVPAQAIVGLLLMGAAAAVTLLLQAVSFDPRWRTATSAPSAPSAEPEPDDQRLHGHPRTRLPVQRPPFS